MNVFAVGGWLLAIAMGPVAIVARAAWPVPISACHDGELTIAAFAARLRSDLDLVSINSDITRTAAVAMQPTQAAIWLRRAQR